MRSRHIALGIMVGGVAAAVVATALPANAVSPNFSLTSGGVSTAGTISYTGSSSSVVLKDLDSGAQVTCTTATAGGTVKRGLNQTGPNIGAISTTQFGTATPPASNGGTPAYGTNPCKGAGVPIAAKQLTTWNINATAFSTANPVPAPASGQTTAGVINNVNARIYVSNTCVFDVVGNGAATGSAAGSYQNTAGTGTLSVASANTPATATLTVANVSLYNGATTCLGGTIVNGHRLSFTGNYAVSAVSPATNPIWVRT